MFNCNVTELTLTREGDLMFQAYGEERYSLIVTLVESAGKGSSIMNMATNGSLDKIFNESAKVMSCNTSLSNGKKVTSSINMVIGDLKKFYYQLKDGAWKAYSQEFDDLMDKTLID